MQPLITIVAFVFLLLLSGCAPSREEIEKEIREQLTTTVTDQVKGEMKKEHSDFIEYKEKKQKLELTDVVPKEGESKLDALIRERQETVSIVAQTKAEIKSKEKLVEEGGEKVKALDAQIKQAEMDRMRFWANLVGGISAALAIILGVVAFLTSDYPVLPKVLRWCALGFGVLSGMAFGFAAIVGYLTIIGLSLGAIIIATGLFFWIKDRKSLTQVVNTVENVKHEIPNYKDKFNMLIDSDVDSYVNEVRQAIKKKLEKENG
jgi:hypothetical protein